MPTTNLIKFKATFNLGGKTETRTLLYSESMKQDRNRLWYSVTEALAKWYGYGFKLINVEEQ